MTTYDFDGKFTLSYNSETGDCFTKYKDGACSERGLVPDDSIHAEALGIKPQEHPLLHELTRHLLAREQNKWTCPIVLNDAYGLGGLKDLNDKPITKPWELRERQITAISYFAMEKPMPRPDDWGAIMDLQKEGIDPFKLSVKIWELFMLGVQNEELNGRFVRNHYIQVK